MLSDLGMSGVEECGERMKGVMERVDGGDVRELVGA